MCCVPLVDQPPERIWRFKLKRHKHSHHLLAMVSDSQKREEMLSRLFSKALPAKQPKLFGFIVLKIHKQQPKSNLKTMPPRALARAGRGGGGGGTNRPDAARGAMVVNLFVAWPVAVQRA